MCYECKMVEQKIQKRHDKAVTESGDSVVHCDGDCWIALHTIEALISVVIQDKMTKLHNLHEEFAEITRDEFEDAENHFLDIAARFASLKTKAKVE